jgi:hypothetical protein
MFCIYAYQHGVAALVSTSAYHHDRVTLTFKLIMLIFTSLLPSSCLRAASASAHAQYKGRAKREGESKTDKDMHRVESMRDEERESNAAATALAPVPGTAHLLNKPLVSHKRPREKGMQVDAQRRRL